jgi:hypothetical protein
LSREPEDLLGSLENGAVGGGKPTGLQPFPSSRGNQGDPEEHGCFSGFLFFSALQVIFLFEKQENVLIRVLICGPKTHVWVAGLVSALRDCELRKTQDTRKGLVSSVCSVI